VVGQDLLTLPGTGLQGNLYSYLAEKLAGYLGLSAEGLPEGGELNELACRFLAQGNQVEDIYPALKTVAQGIDSLPIPEPLLQLAAIRPLELFVTTTFDSFLARALNRQRFGGSTRTQILAYAPNQIIEDLPTESRSAGLPIVYHLFGRLSATPSYAVTQEDIVEFFHALQSPTRQPKLLFDELNRKSLLLIGSRFNGWLTRFFIRMAKTQRLSAGGRSDYLADAEVSNDHNLVAFLKHFSKATKVFRSGSAVEFVAELHRRWTERHPGGSERVSASVEGGPAHLPVEQGAVFLSYASADFPAANKIKAALEDAGVAVFIDREGLQSGDDWEAKLRSNIHQCCLFLPIISRQTLTSDRRFFRVEWNLALEEAQMASFAEDEAFLLPVVIDDTPISEPAIPARFRKVQWTSLPEGLPTPAFVTRIQQLYRKHQKVRARRS
jgi:hypothetical protein